MSPRRLRLAPLLALAGLLVSCPLALAQAAATAPTAPKTATKAKQPFPTHFAKPTSVDCASVLPPPPAPGSLSARADLEAVLQAQVWRTPEHVAWAKRVEKNDLFLFADVIGPWFKRENLPVTAAFLKAVDEDRHEITEVAKKLFARPRPWVVDPRVQPVVGKPGNDSYPSGHTSSIFTKAGVLAEVFPELRTELFDFAHRAAWSRVFGGVHFPSDLVGGWGLAEQIVVELKRSPAFQERLQAVRTEIAAQRRR